MAGSRTIVEILLQAKDATARAFGAVGGRLRSLRDSIFSIRTAVAGFVAFVTTQVVGKIVKAFAEQEQAIIRLNTALRVTGRYTEDGTKKIQAMATEMQNLTTVTDEAALGISATLAQLATGLTTDQLAEAQKAVIGLSSAFGIDLQSAATLVGKTLSGEMNALGRYGIRIDETADQQGKFNQILRQTVGYFDVAVGATQSLTGQWQQAKNAAGELLETFGQIIAESFHLNDAQRSLRDRINALNEKVRANIGTWVRWGQVVVGAVKAAVVVLANLVKAAFNVGQVIGDVFTIWAQTAKLKFTAMYNAAVETFLNPLIEALNSINVTTKLVQIGNNLARYGKIAFATFKAIVGSFGSVIKFFFNAGQVIGDVFVIIYQTAKRNMMLLSNTVIDALNTIIAGFNLLPGVDIPLLQGFTAGEVGAVTDAITDAKAQIVTDAADINAALNSIVETWRPVVAELKKPATVAVEVAPIPPLPALPPVDTAAAAEAMDAARDRLVTDTNDIRDAMGNIVTAWRGVIAELKKPVKAAATFDIATAGGGANAPVDQRRVTEQAAQDRTKEARRVLDTFSVGGISTEQFSRDLERLAPQLMALKNSGELTHATFMEVAQALDKMHEAADQAGLGITSLGDTSANTFGQSFAQQVYAAVDAVGTLNDALAVTTYDALTSFGNAAVEAFGLLTEGSQQSAHAFEASMLNALAGVASSYSQMFAAQALAAIGLSLVPPPLGSPRSAAGAGYFLAAAAAMAALAGALRGAAARTAGGAGGGGGAAGATARTSEAAREQQPLTVILRGPMWRATAPEFVDLIAAAFGEATSRNVIIEREE